MRCIIFGCLFLLLIFNSGTIPAQEPPVIFATGEWPPYTTEHRKGFGLATELVTAACKEAGIAPVYHFYPWPRAEMSVKEHVAFAAFPYIVTPERKKQYLLSEPIITGVNAFLYFDGNHSSIPPLEFKTLADLKKYSICVIRGDSFEKEMEQAGLKTFAANDAASCIKMLKYGRVDFYIGEKASIYDHIKSLFPEESEHFRFLQHHYGDARPNSLIISKTYPNAMDILERFNKGLRAIRENGTYEGIRAKYTPAGK